MTLEEIVSDVENQLDAQARLGVQIEKVDDVPEEGPVNKGIWHRINNVTAIYADLKQSTELNTEGGNKNAAFAYTFFIRAMTKLLEGFGAKYIDIQGDGIFGLFSGSNSVFDAIACAVTMKTMTEDQVASHFRDKTNSDWVMAAGFGIDRGTLMVRRLGLRGTKQNEVWAGRPVNIASKLSSLAKPNKLVVPDRVYKLYEKASKLRQRAILRSCGCTGGDGQGEGLDGDSDCHLWTKKFVNASQHLDFDRYYSLGSHWCDVHGSEFCHAIVNNSRP